MNILKQSNQLMRLVSQLAYHLMFKMSTIYQHSSLKRWRTADRVARYRPIRMACSPRHATSVYTTLVLGRLFLTSFV